MRKTFLEVGVDWAGPGYFASEFSPADLATRPERERTPWINWDQAFVDGKRGKFDRIVDLIAVYEGGYDWLLSGACSDLLGDAGTEESLRRMAERLEHTDDPIIAVMMRIDFSCALTMAGRLTYLPAIIEAYTKVHTFNDSDVVPYAISSMLESQLGKLCDPASFPSIGAYRDAVLVRGRELADKFGPDAAVFAGEPYSVIRIARAVLGALAGGGPLDISLRQRFEATTGIPTAAFFEGNALQPLTAATIVEGFLDSQEAAQYREGVRYFFGHTIP